jgi:heterodisulfide reductase subunit D
VSLEELKGAIYRCHHCRACSLTDSDEIGWHRVCPTYEAHPFEHYAAGGRIAIARAWLEDLIEKPEEIIDSIYSCLGCGACQEICQSYTDIAFPLPDGIDTPRIIRELRKELVLRGLNPQIMKALDQGIQNTSNAFGGNQSAKKQFAEKYKLPSAGETLFFAGCYSFYGGRGEILDNIMKIFRSTNENVAFLAEQELCCGILQHANGNTDLCRKLAMHNVETVKQAGAKRIVTTCAGCFHALKSVYPHIIGDELPFQVLHTSQYLSSLLEENKLEFKQEVCATVTYHDPCHLGRLSKIYEEPRNVLNQIPGLTFREMEKAKEQAWCCGGGEGIVSLAYPQLASKIANKRISQAQQTGASTIITTCPHCNAVLNMAATREMPSLACKDLSELVAKSMDL